MTKRHEEQVGPTVDRALLHFQPRTRPKGTTVVLEDTWKSENRRR